MKWDASKYVALIWLCGSRLSDENMFFLSWISESMKYRGAQET